MMNIIRHTVSLLAIAVCAAGCAHTISTNEQADYFECKGATIDGAVESLEANGHKLPERTGDGDGPIETGWSEFQLSQNDAKQFLTLRLQVEPAADGVRFSIWETTSQGLLQWDPITKRQLDDDVYRALLNKLRKDVCGGEDFFAAR